MSPGDWAIILPAMVALPRIAAALEAMTRRRLAGRSDPPKSSSSSGDKVKAVVLELGSADTADKVNQLHEALAQRDPLTRAYLIPVHLQKQTDSLKVVEVQTVRQTQLLEKIAGGTPPPGIKGRY